jgi:poly-gamma-glutamate synthesis protein (capsule biosynthesis protein)
MGRTRALLTDPQTAFGPIAAVLSDADVTAVNLETAVTSRGSPQPKRFHFQAPPSAFEAVRAAGIDMVTLANNHILDYGRVGLTDTLAAARAAGFPTVGAGADARAAWAPWITTVRGTRIAYLGVSDVQELSAGWIATPNRSGEAIANNLRRTLDAVTAARQHADVVVVFMHWGTEGDACPDGSQRGLASQLSKAGATIIIGSHVHTLQASGWLGNTFVAYGMGNFLWYIPSWSTETGVLRLTLNVTPTGALSSRPLTARLFPAVVSGTGQPVVQTGSKAKSILRRYASLRACAHLTATPPP